MADPSGMGDTRSRSEHRTALRLPRTASAADRRANRRGAIDVARCLALVVVVFGHLGMAVVDRHAGTVRGANLFALRPGWSWIAFAAPMPIFFAAAGWANASSTLTNAAGRLRALVGLTGMVVAAWSVPVILASLLAGGPGGMGSGARLATQPLWFLAAYLPLAAAGGALAQLAAKRPATAIGTCVATLAVLDLIRFVLHGPGWIGWVGFLPAWSAPALAGAWWRARHEAGAFQERRVGLTLLVGFGTAGAALVAFGGYQASLIDAVPGARSNTSPPTLYTAIVALAQVGALMVAAGALDQVGRRARALWDWLGAAAVGIYLWHLSALVMGAGLIGLGLPTPERLTRAWWLTRPLWFAIVLGLAAALVAGTAAIRTRLASPTSRATAGPPRCAWLGITIASVAAATVGLKGPTSLGWAAICTALFAMAWWFMSVATIREGHSVNESRRSTVDNTSTPCPSGSDTHTADTSNAASPTATVRRPPQWRATATLPPAAIAPTPPSNHIRALPSADARRVKPR